MSNRSRITFAIRDRAIDPICDPLRFLELVRDDPETRRRRQEKRIYEVAGRIVDGQVFGPAENCYLCGRGLGDPESIRRGLGSECWQFILAIIKAPA